MISQQAYQTPDSRFLSLVGAALTDGETHPASGSLVSWMIAIHGAQRFWQGNTRIRGNVTIKGTIWNENGGEVPYADARFEMTTREPWVRILPSAVGATESNFKPNILTLRSPGGGFVETQYNPRSSFERGVERRKWDAFEAAYICSYSIWTCLTQPFLFQYPGFETKEIAPLCMSGESWRRLVITFPGHVASHSDQMICHVGPDGLLRRQDFCFDVMNKVPVMSFPSNYREIGGIKVPLLRRMYRTTDMVGKDDWPVLAAIEFSNLEYTTYDRSAQSADCH